MTDSSEPRGGASGTGGAAPEIAVLIPCLDEALTVAEVVRDFAKELPGARIYVFDNGSTDGTAKAAAEAGAIVCHEAKRGKGHVLAAMLAQVDADLYVLVDGDATYPASAVHDLIAPVREGKADHAVGARRAADAGKAYRPLHTAGNRLITSLVNRVFGTHLEDVMSGYRVFTREVAESVPVLSRGFDVETEFTLQCLEKGFTIVEAPVPYLARPEGSRSKLNTFSDGRRVLLRILTILKDFRPFAFFGGLALVSAILSLLAGSAPIADYLREPDHYVRHVPLAILAGFLGLISIVLLTVGTLLATINSRFRELSALRRRDLARSRRPAAR